MGASYESPFIAGSPSVLRDAATILALAEKEALRSVALPAISCGVFRFPVVEAARIAMAVSRDRRRELDEIRFVLLDEETFDVFARARADAA
ncbi:MAG: macro domain-containing protein [Sandaracinus sp.]